MPKWKNPTRFEIYEFHNAYEIGWGETSEGSCIEAIVYFEYPNPNGEEPIKHKQVFHLDPDTKKVIQEEFFYDEEGEDGPERHEKIYGYLRDVYFPAREEFPPRSKKTRTFSLVGEVTYSNPVVFYYQDPDDGCLRIDKGCYLHPRRKRHHGSWHVLDKQGRCYDNFIPNPWVIWWCRLPGK